MTHQAEFSGLPLEEINAYLKRRIDAYETAPSVYDFGTVTSVNDTVVHLSGLPGRRKGELLEFEGGVFGMAMDLSLDDVGAVLLSEAQSVRVGSRVRGTGRVMEAPAGSALLGRTIDPIGRPLDGRQLTAHRYLPIEREAPGIIDRQKVDTPLMTGLLVLDSMIPIGRGQRELIIGDRQTGKTSIAVDAILNQKNSNVICIYCAIAQKASTIAEVLHTFENAGAMEYTVVVASTASDSPAMQYIAPYAACAIAEGFMYKGKDVLVVYDDLSKHAVAYRAMSLLLHRPSGREAYPGDVFYLHSRLLERSARLSDRLGGGSMTALPIIETMGGDISAYIPTNVISITDGQIFLESELFHSGVRPAVNVGLSVSRVGRSAQYPAMRKVCGTLRIDLAQYHELAIFTQFGADVDTATRQALERGARLTEALKQSTRKPLPLSSQVCILLAVAHDALKDVEVAKVRPFLAALLASLAESCPGVLARIDQTGELSEKSERLLNRLIAQFAQKEAAHVGHE